MSIDFIRFICVLILGSGLLTSCGGNKNSTMTAVFEPQSITTGSTPSQPHAPGKTVEGKQTAVFAGGCFWGVEAVFEYVKGVSDVTSEYSGGAAKTANYEAVGGGDTGHAETVEITFDPSLVSYEQLLKVFFSVAHDPTELNRQGPDTGTQYRSAIFYTNDDQKRLAESYVAELTAAKVFDRPVVTQITALDAYYKAEDYHQDYLMHHPNQPYIVINDQPKVENLRKQFPELYMLK
jgi:peptide-methionine (S)-S-oxide reductase